MRRAVSGNPGVLGCASHFEKMSYDNSQLARVYLHAWQVTGNEFFRTVTEEILDYVMREMLDPAGGFYSTQDADSEGEEGKFFVWTPDEIREVLGDEADAFMAAYGVTRHGNSEGRNILPGGGPGNAQSGRCPSPVVARSRPGGFSSHPFVSILI